MSGNPIGIVLGSGLGAFADTLSSRTETSYKDIADWPASTAVGHAGQLVTGTIGDADVIVLAGRAHLYEGYAPSQVVFGIRELARRGVKSVVLTNAAGGINLSYKPGDLVLISDHINLTGQNPLLGPNDDALGPRFPDMSEIYSASNIARRPNNAPKPRDAISTKASTPGCWAPATKHPPRSVICAPSARTSSACRRSSKQSWPHISA